MMKSIAQYQIPLLYQRKLKKIIYEVLRNDDAMAGEIESEAVRVGKTADVPVGHCGLCNSAVRMANTKENDKTGLPVLKEC